MAPLGRATELKRRIIFRALRSRFFFIVALLTAVPTFLEATGATWKAARGNPQVGPFLLWAVAIAAWILFTFTVHSEHWSLQRRSGRKQTLRRVHRKTSDEPDHVPTTSDGDA